MTATMDSFDPLAYLSSPLPYGGGTQGLDYMSTTSALDPLDQYSNFDSEPYMSDDMSFHHSGGIPHPAMMKRYSTGMDDPFADGAVPTFENMPPDSSPTSPSIDRDSRYLTFSMPNFPYALLNESFQRSSININAQLHGMFFLAESQWPTSGDTAPPPPELTCYRRNLFQITGNITLPRSLRYIFTEEGTRIPIYELELHVSATESVEGNAVKIISVPWKTPAGGDSAKPEDKIEREPPTIPLDKMAGADMDTDYTTFPFQWKRLQFRIATANNGRRRELQQHFTLHLKVMASLSTGGKFPIAEAHSGAVIVRGRSPRNFASRKDLPLSSSSTSRKHVPAASRTSISQPAVTSAPQLPSPQDDMPPATTQAFDSPPGLVAGPDGDGWAPQQPTSFPEQLVTGGFMAPMYPPPTMPGFGHPSPDTTGPYPFAFSPTAGAHHDTPVSLHFESDTEGTSPHSHQASRNSSKAPTSNPSPSLLTQGRTATMPAGVGPDQVKRPRLHAHPGSSASAPTMGGVHPHGGPPGLDRKLYSAAATPYSPHSDTVDHLYEYFPLTVEDWQPPVDAVFRPHVVHHSTPSMADPRSPVGGRNSKRYFSEVA